MGLFYKSVCGGLHLFFSLCYTLEIKGKENIPKGRALLAANHASYFDPPLIGAALDEEPLYLMIHSLRKKPLLGRILEALHAYPVGEEGKEMETLRRTLYTLREGRKVVIFPEGRRSDDGMLGPLQTGVASLAIRTKSPIVPVWIEGAYEIWNRHRSFPRLGGKLTCRFGPPIDPSCVENIPKEERQIQLLNHLKEQWKMLQAL